MHTKRETVVLASYPRSGNSLVRRLLECWSGLVTGSDTRPYRSLSLSLVQCGYRGEGIADNSVWIVKSHFPERLGYVRIETRTVLLVVRNPFDAILSYFHMSLTNTHNKTLAPEVRVFFYVYYDKSVIGVAKIIC